ncbi:MAG: glycosyltransferase family 4 protein [bacterium]
MNIGMILDKTFPPDPRVENEARQLIKHGHKVFLFCLNFTNQPEFEIINNIAVYRYKFSKKLYKKISPLAYTIPLYHWILKKKIIQFLEKVSIDVLHIHDMTAAHSVFKLHISAPKILDIHENQPEIMKSYTHVINGIGKYLINPKKWKKKECSFIKKADKTIVVTPEAKQYYLHNIKRLKEEDIIYAPNTVDLDIFLNYTIKSEILHKFKDNFILLYLGSVAKRRGIDTVIKGINILKSKIPDIKFVVVGGNTRDITELKKMIYNLKINNYVCFEGWQHLSLFPSYIKSSDICVSPLKRNIHHDTTLANKLFQYMSIGKPVVVSDCPAQANIVKSNNCGLVYTASDADDFAKQVLTLYKDDVLRENMGRNSKKTVKEKYNWGKTGNYLVEFYQSLVVTKQERN